MPQEFFSNTLGTQYIKALVSNIALPKYLVVTEGDYIIGSDYCTDTQAPKYIYRNRIINCTKSGYLGKAYWDKLELKTVYKGSNYTEVENPYLIASKSKIDRKVDGTETNKYEYIIKIGEYLTLNSEQKYEICMSNQNGTDIGSNVLKINYSKEAIEAINDIIQDKFIQIISTEIIGEDVKYVYSDIFHTDNTSAFFCTSSSVNCWNIYKKYDLTPQTVPSEFIETVSATIQNSTLPYPENGKLNGNWYRLRDKTEVPNQINAEYEVIDEFTLGEYIPQLTELYHSNTSYYDSGTHEVLGKYINIINKLYDINLNPYYNYFSNRELNSYYIGKKNSVLGQLYYWRLYGLKNTWKYYWQRYYVQYALVTLHTKWITDEYPIGNHIYYYNSTEEVAKTSKITKYSVKYHASTSTTASYCKFVCEKYEATSKKLNELTVGDYIPIETNFNPIILESEGQEVDRVGRILNIGSSEGWIAITIRVLAPKYVEKDETDNIKPIDVITYFNHNYPGVTDPPDDEYVPASPIEGVSRVHRYRIKYSYMWPYWEEYVEQSFDQPEDSVVTSTNKEAYPLNGAADDRSYWYIYYKGEQDPDTSKFLAGRYYSDYTALPAKGYVNDYEYGKVYCERSLETQVADNILTEQLNTISPKEQTGNLTIKGYDYELIQGNDITHHDWLIPIDFNKDYTIALDSESTVVILPIMIKNGRLITAYLPNKSSISLTEQLKDQMYYKVTSKYNQPFIYRVNLNFNIDLTDDEKLVQKLLYENSEYLYMLLQTPATNTSAITVLEGDWRNKETCIEYYDRVSFDRLTEQEQNKLFLSTLSLLKVNNGVSYPFSDRLIEYLTERSITYLDPISENIKYIQESNLGNAQALANGIWDVYLREHTFKYVEEIAAKSIIDYNGYIDKDTENKVIH